MFQFYIFEFNHAWTRGNFIDDLKSTKYIEHICCLDALNNQIDLFDELRVRLIHILLVKPYSKVIVDIIVANIQ